MKVYLQYPWKVSDSQYYKSLIDNPPREVGYLSKNTKPGMITNKRKLVLTNFVKRFLRESLERANFPILNIKKTETKEEYDLIHCAHCLSSNNTPWVVDFESLWQMWISGRDTPVGRRKALKILKKEHCKRIIAWTETTKKEIQEKFPEIKEKVTVVSYGMISPVFKKVKSKKIRLLFIGRYFHDKGGLHALEAMDKLTKKYTNVEALVISQVPQDVLKKYSNNKKIIFKELVPYKEIIKNVYPKSDIFIYPGYSDTFGFAFIEASAFGLPVVTVDGHARRDLITEGETGFIIKRNKNIDWYPNEEEEKRIVKELIKKTAKLIEDKDLREKMSKKGIKVVKEGKFSIKERNKRLGEVYNEARNI